MKRIVPSALVAIGVHVFLLSANFDLPRSSVALPEIPERLTVVMVPAPMPVKNPLPNPLPPPISKLLAKAETVETLPELPGALRAAEPVSEKAPPKPKKPPKALTETPRRRLSQSQPAQQSRVRSESQSAFPSPATAPESAKPAAPAAAVDTSPHKATAVAAVSKQRRILPDRPVIPLSARNPPPAYPRSARRRGYQGLVLLKALVGVDGRVEKAEIDQSCGYDILDRKALAAVRKWQFEPGIKGGKKVRMWVKVPVRFKLK